MNKPTTDEHHQWLLQVMADHREMTRQLKTRRWLHQQWPSNLSALAVIEQRDRLEDATDLLLLLVPTEFCAQVYALRRTDTSTF